MKKLLLFLFLVSCVSLPIQKPCEQWDSKFKTLDFFVQHKSCGNMDVVTHKIKIDICYNGEWKTTNIWATWDGCDYWLVQQDKKKIITLEYFKNIEEMRNFLKETLPQADLIDRDKEK
jgi:hypothetical protein